MTKYDTDYHAQRALAAVQSCVEVECWTLLSNLSNSVHETGRPTAQPFSESVGLFLYMVSKLV